MLSRGEVPAVLQPPHFLREGVGGGIRTQNFNFESVSTNIFIRLMILTDMGRVRLLRFSDTLFWEVNMKTYDEVQSMLEEIIDDTPEQLFDELSGGVVLAEEAKLHPDSKPLRPLYIMGEYRTDITGSRIVIYYGSFVMVYGRDSTEKFREKLRHTFAHELRHHAERLSGIKDLEDYDRQKLDRYYLGMDIAEFHEPPIE